MNFFDLENATMISQLLGLAIPFLVALVTKRVASGGLKGVINLLLSAIAGSVTYLVASDGGYDVTGFVNSTVNVFIVSITAYYGVYKPTGVSETVQNKTANIGLGKPELTTDDAVEVVEVPAEPAIENVPVEPEVIEEPEVLDYPEEPTDLPPVRTRRKRVPRKRV